jgi:hypothetical protein
MSDTQIKVPLTLNERSAMALAQLAKRFTFEDATRLSDMHNGSRERDDMIEGVISLQSALRERGFAPR